MTVRPAQITDAERLAPNLREWDRRELESLCDTPAREALAMQIALAGECFAATHKHNVIALFGVTPINPFTARVGLLCSRHISRHRLACLRLARQHLRVWLCRWRVLFNIVATANRMAVRWLAMLGARFTGGHAVINGLDFAAFTITKESLCVP